MLRLLEDIRFAFHSSFIYFTTHPPRRCCCMQPSSNWKLNLCCACCPWDLMLRWNGSIDVLLCKMYCCSTLILLFLLLEQWIYRFQSGKRFKNGNKLKLVRVDGWNQFQSLIRSGFQNLLYYYKRRLSKWIFWVLFFVLFFNFILYSKKNKINDHSK